MENSMAGSQNQKTKFPYDPTIQTLGIYLKELRAGSWREFILKFMVALFKNSQKVEATQAFNR